MYKVCPGCESEMRFDGYFWKCENCNIKVEEPIRTAYLRKHKPSFFIWLCRLLWPIFLGVSVIGFWYLVIRYIIGVLFNVG